MLGAQIGDVKVGSEHKIALQTMTTTDTRDIDGTVDQVRFQNLEAALYGAGITPAQGYMARACERPQNGASCGYSQTSVGDVLLSLHFRRIFRHSASANIGHQ